MEQVPHRVPRGFHQDLAQRRTGGGPQGFGDAVGVHRLAGTRGQGSEGAARGALPQFAHSGVKVIWGRRNGRASIYAISYGSPRARFKQVSTCCMAGADIRPSVCAIKLWSMVNKLVQDTTDR